MRLVPFEDSCLCFNSLLTHYEFIYFTNYTSQAFSDVSPAAAAHFKKKSSAGTHRLQHVHQIPKKETPCYGAVRKTFRLIPCDFCHRSVFMNLSHYSPASCKACCSMSSFILKPVRFILASKGFMDAMMPVIFALIMTPTVPV